jgi:hypothetical protein
LLKRKLKGPQWIKIRNFQKCIGQTWCKQQIMIDNPKNVYYDIEDLNTQSPPMTCLTFSLKTTRSDNNTNEVAMISCLALNDLNQDGPTNSTKLNQFSIMRKLDKKPWPFDFQQKLKQKNDGSVQTFETER